MYDEIKELEDNELYEQLKKVENEIASINSRLEQYQEDIEEGNYDGDSIELTANIVECEEERDLLLREIQQRNLEIPENYQHYMAEGF